jgi:predicted ATPase
MHKVRRLRITGFRRLCEVDIAMRPLMVLIGANGVGKSSFLDAVSLLSASANGEMNELLSDFGGLAATTTIGKARKITFEAEMECTGVKPLHYQLEIEAKGQGYGISLERLTQEQDGNYAEPFKHIDSRYDDIKYYDVDTKKLVRPEWEHSRVESSLSQVQKMFRQPEELRRTLSSTVAYHVLDVSPRAPVRLPQQMKDAQFPGADGESLIPFLYNLRESDAARYDTIIDTLRAAFPGFEKLSFPPVATGMLTLTWKEKYFPDPLYTHQLSEGTLRFLWLVALLQSPQLPTVTMIDEPEVSLHPELLSLLAEVMREAATRTQLIVATHSDRLIRFLEPREVVVMDIGDDGCAWARWADTLNLEEWLSEYSLDEVWRMGRMGGRA